MSNSKPTLGIRHEDKSPWERRVPLTPQHVRVLIDEHGLDIAVQTSPTRIFDDEQYRRAGARVVDSLDAVPLVLGVKEIPKDQLYPGASYMYFSHVIKGQSYNMAMLQTLLDRGCNLLDYEKIADEAGRRLVFFGRHAGLAGMIDTLWTLGQRWQAQGHHAALAQVKRAHEYKDVAEAKTHIRELGVQLARDGVPQAMRPLVIGVSGYGNVSRGAQEILSSLPAVEVTPDQLLAQEGMEDPASQVYKVVFEERHMVRPVDEGAAFELQHYFDHPEAYTGQFARFHPLLSVLVNCIYWDTPYPRLVTKEQVRAMWAQGAEPKLQVFGDISCDIDGSIEITGKATPVDKPAFVYLVDEDRMQDGITGRGPAVMSVDNLPCELPADASQSFGDALLPFVAALARAASQTPLAADGLPDELRRALIVHDGVLAPDFTYLKTYLTR